MNNQGDWIQTTNRFVAFFDIMGFKDLVLKKNHEDILVLLKKLSQNVSHLSDVNNYKSEKGTQFGETKSFIFSDSIIIFSKGMLEPDLNKIIIDSIYLLTSSMENMIPIKGALSFGKITVDLEKSLYFGQPIIDAFLLHEDLALYGVIADHSFENAVTNIDPDLLENQFVLWKTPLKSGKISHYLLDPLLNDKDTFESDLKKLYSTVSGRPRIYIDNSLELYKYLKETTQPKS